jgi:hypothetical protein
MLSQQANPAAHAGETLSPEFAARSAHWKTVGDDLLKAVVGYVKEYLQEEHDDALVCASADHHSAVRSLFDAIKRADAAGLAKACDDLQAATGAGKLGLWSATTEDFAICTLSELIAAHDWLQPGHVVYFAQRRVLTQGDFNAAGAAEIARAA